MRIRKKRSNVSKRELNKVRTRKKISGTDERPRLCVFRSNKFSYAQIVTDDSGATLASASTASTEVEALAKSITVEGANAKSTKSVAAAKALGLTLAKRAIEKGVKAVVFDRSGYQYKGRVKAIADGAREGGLQF